MHKIKDLLFSDSPEKLVKKHNAASTADLNQLLGKQTASILAAASLAMAAACHSPEDKPELPVSAPVAPQTMEAKEQKRFTVGPFEFIQDAQMSDASFERTQVLLTKAYPIFQKYLPVESLQPKQVQVKRYEKSSQARANYQNGVVLIGDTVTDGLILHEFTHLLHGEFDLYYDFVEEGLATGLSILTSEALGVESWDRTVSVQMNGNLERFLPTPPQLSYQFNPPLSALRNERAGYFWIDLEKRKPGAIHAFHQAYYAHLKQGGKREDFWKPELMQQVMTTAGLEEAYREQVKRNSIAQYDESADFSQPSVLAYYVHYSNDQTRQLIVLAALKDDKKQDQNLRKIEVMFDIENLDTGKKTKLLKAGPEIDKLAINLDKPKEGSHFLEEQVGPGKRYRVNLKVPLPDGRVLEDTVEFDYL